MGSSCHIPVQHCVGMRTLTEPSDQTEPLYRWAAQPESARTHRLPEPRFHLGPESAAACTGNKKTLTGDRRENRRIYDDGRWNCSLTWMMLCMCGMRRSMRTSSSITRALQTFFRTSLSSSPASANRLCKGRRVKHKNVFKKKQEPHRGNEYTGK